MQYLTLTKSLKKLHTLKRLKYRVCLTSPALSLWKFHFQAISGHLTQSSPIYAIPPTNRPNPIQSMDESNPCPTLGWMHRPPFLTAAIAKAGTVFLRLCVCHCQQKMVLEVLEPFGVDHHVRSVAIGRCLYICLSRYSQQNLVGTIASRPLEMQTCTKRDMEAKMQVVLEDGRSTNIFTE